MKAREMSIRRRRERNILPSTRTRGCVCNHGSLCVLYWLYYAALLFFFSFFRLLSYTRQRYLFSVYVCNVIELGKCLPTCLIRSAEKQTQKRTAVAAAVASSIFISIMEVGVKHVIYWNVCALSLDFILLRTSGGQQQDVEREMRAL